MCHSLTEPNVEDANQWCQRTFNMLEMYKFSVRYFAKFLACYPQSSFFIINICKPKTVGYLREII
jgi:hypothetical protein